jgi:hypothetical protein
MHLERWLHVLWCGCKLSGLSPLGIWWVLSRKAPCPPINFRLQFSKRATPPLSYYGRASEEFPLAAAYQSFMRSYKLWNLSSLPSLSPEWELVSPIIIGSVNPQFQPPKNNWPMLVSVLKHRAGRLITSQVRWFDGTVWAYLCTVLTITDGGLEFPYLLFFCEGVVDTW